MLDLLGHIHYTQWHREQKCHSVTQRVPHPSPPQFRPVAPHFATDYIYVYGGLHHIDNVLTLYIGHMLYIIGPIPMYTDKMRIVFMAWQVKS